MDHILPPDVAVRLVDSELPWERATQFQIADFFREYTLHDSLWLGVHLDCGWSDVLVAAISFDPVWNQSVAPPTGLVADWPFLFLRFECVSSVSLSGFSDIGGLQRGISAASTKCISDEEAITTVMDHYGASVVVLHFSLIKALLLSPGGEPIAFPTGVVPDGE